MNYLKALFLSLFFSVLIFSPSNAEIIFFDNFEPHDVGQYPSGDYWYNLYSGVSAEITTGYTYGSSPQSFRLEGYSNWSRIDGINLDYNNELTYQVCLYIPDSQRGVIVGFFESHGNMAPSYNALIFRNDGKICLHDSGEPDVEMQAYNSNQWYIVTVCIDFNNNIMDIYLDGEKINSGSPRSDRSHCNTFALSTNNFNGSGTAVAYYDNVTVSDDFIPTSKSVSTIGNICAFAYDWYYSKNLNRDGRYAETRLDVAQSFSDQETISLALWNWYSQASGSAHCKVYLSTNQQVTPTDDNHNLITWWVGNTVNLGTLVGEYDAVNTIVLLNIDVRDYIKSHPSDHYYVAIKNDGSADAAAYGVYLTGKAATSNNCLYVVDTPDTTISSILNELDFGVTTSTMIPSDLSSYKLVICRDYSACNSNTASYVGNYVKSGGCVILMGGTPSSFCGGGYSTSCISEWFGTSQYSNVGVSDAKVSFNNPLNTSLARNDVIEHCGGWGGAAVKNVTADATILAEWDYGTGNIHSFIRSYQSGRVAFWAGNASYNSKTTELFKAVCQWATSTFTAVNNFDNNSKPNLFSLSQNYPNPFNPTTTIEYSIEKASFVKLSIYNILGERIKVLINENHKSGKYSVVWNGTNENDIKVTSGIYFYRIQINGFDECNKMNILK